MKKKTIVVALMLSLFFGTFGIFNASSAYDGGWSEYKFSKKMQVVQAGENKYFVNIKGQLKGGKIKKITSSKKNIVKPLKGSGNYLYDGKYIAFQAKKLGKSTLKITIKKGKKTRTLKTTVKVVKYTNPFKSFKVNKEEIKNSFDSGKEHPAYDFNNLKSVSLNIEPKKGWIIKSIKNGSESLKNKSKIDVGNLDIGIDVSMYNKSRNLYIDTTLLTIVF